MAGCVLIADSAGLMERIYACGGALCNQRPLRRFVVSGQVSRIWRRTPAIQRAMRPKTGRGAHMQTASPRRGAHMQTAPPRRGAHMQTAPPRRGRPDRGTGVTGPQTCLRGGSVVALGQVVVGNHFSG